MNDRIKLVAEAMGWTRIESIDGRTYYGLPPGCKIDAESILGWTDACLALPDPENDANDDYAVLEWARTQPKEWKWLYMDEYFAGRLARNELDHRLPVYQIGDYFRAALRALE